MKSVCVAFIFLFFSHDFLFSYEFTIQRALRTYVDKDRIYSVHEYNNLLKKRRLNQLAFFMPRIGAGFSNDSRIENISDDTYSYEFIFNISQNLFSPSFVMNTFEEKYVVEQKKNEIILSEYNSEFNFVNIYATYLILLKQEKVFEKQMFLAKKLYIAIQKNHDLDRATLSEVFEMNARLIDSQIAYVELLKEKKKMEGEIRFMLGVPQSQELKFLDEVNIGYKGVVNEDNFSRIEEGLSLYLTDLVVAKNEYEFNKKKKTLNYLQWLPTVAVNLENKFYNYEIFPLDRYAFKVEVVLGFLFPILSFGSKNKFGIDQNNNRDLEYDLLLNKLEADSSTAKDYNFEFFENTLDNNLGYQRSYDKLYKVLETKDYIIDIMFEEMDIKERRLDSIRYVRDALEIRRVAVAAEFNQGRVALLDFLESEVQYQEKLVEMYNALLDFINYENVLLQKSRSLDDINEIISNVFVMTAEEDGVNEENN